MTRRPFDGRFGRIGRWLFLLVWAASAHARGLLVSPTQVGMTAKPGQIATGVIYISSSKEEKNRVMVTIGDFTRSEEGGVVEMSKTHPRSCRTWLDVDRSELESPEAGRVELTVSARIPEGARGSYWALVLLSAEPPARTPAGPLAIHVVPRIAIPVIVTVEGTAKPKLKIVETRAIRTPDGVDVYSIVENIGDVATLVSGAFSLERASGQAAAAAEELGSAEVGPLTSLPGTRLKVKARLIWKGALANVEAHAYLRFGAAPDETAEAAVAIEGTSSK